jgi:hypothetical protein
MAEAPAGPARTKLGQKVDLTRAEKGAPPVVFAVQPTHFIRIDSPEELKQFQQDLQNFFGINIEASRMAGHACETCSGGCTDDCGMM